MYFSGSEQFFKLEKFAQFDDLQHFSTILNAIEYIQIIKVEIIDDFAESLVHDLLFKINYYLVIFGSKARLLLL